METLDAVVEGAMQMEPKDLEAIRKIEDTQDFTDPHATGLFVTEEMKNHVAEDGDTFITVDSGDF